MPAVSVAASGSRDPAAASTTASPGRRTQPAPASRPCRASTSSGWGPSGAATRVRAGKPAAISGMSRLTW
ncbi:hypothetical protein SFUMM280S_08964 [Streptomyces fumanus]